MNHLNVTDKLWAVCDILRADGMNIGTYVEQLTLLLYLKMLHEREQAGAFTAIRLPEGYGWGDLLACAGEELLARYEETLSQLGQLPALADAFRRVRSAFRTPANLQRAPRAVDEVAWTALDVDVKGAAYESLLARYAAEAKGAGEYFTPRPAIRAAVQVIDPTPADTIHDPAAGTGGFLVGALEHIKAHHRTRFIAREAQRRVFNEAFSGVEKVEETYRLLVMNLTLHNLNPDGVKCGDSLSGAFVHERFSVVLTNPPYGLTLPKEMAKRADWAVETRASELAFLQHVKTILRKGGRAAVVVPDGVLFQAEQAARVRQVLMEDCDLHTVLVMPQNAFVPYTGTNTNILFFTKGKPTEWVWFYDLRTGVPPITKKERPLTDELFADFLAQHKVRAEEGANPETERSWSAHVNDIRKNGWLLKPELYRPAHLAAQTPDQKPPDQLAAEIAAHLEAALADIRAFAEEWR